MSGSVRRQGARATWEPARPAPLRRILVIKGPSRSLSGWPLPPLERRSGHRAPAGDRPGRGLAVRRSPAWAGWRRVAHRGCGGCVDGRHLSACSAAFSVRAAGRSACRSPMKVDVIPALTGLCVEGTQTCRSAPPAPRSRCSRHRRRRPAPPPPPVAATSPVPSQRRRRRRAPTRLRRRSCPRPISLDAGRCPTSPRATGSATRRTAARPRLTGIEQLPGDVTDRTIDRVIAADTLGPGRRLSDLAWRIAQ